MSVVISTKCNLLLLRNNVSRPTIRLRERSTNGNSRSTGLLPGTSFIGQATPTANVMPARYLLLVNVVADLFIEPAQPHLDLFVFRRRGGPEGSDRNRITQCNRIPDALN